MKKFRPLQSDPFIRIPQDQALAKFGHINNIVDEINNIPPLVIIRDVTPTTNFTVGYLFSRKIDGTVGEINPNTLSTDVTIGVSDIVLGTPGSVLFVGAGSLLQQDNTNLFWNNITKRLGIGTSSPSARLQIIAQGALPVFTALDVRNFANTASLLSVRGDGSLVRFNNAGSQIFTQLLGGALATGVGSHTNLGTSDINLGGTLGVAGNRRLSILGYTNNFFAISIGNSSQSLGSASLSIGYSMIASASASTVIGAGNVGSITNNISNSFMWGVVAALGESQSFFINDNSNLVLASKQTLVTGTHYNAAATNTFTIRNGVATGAIVDTSQLYSQDVVAGNAAIHAMTELGDIVRLFSVGGWGTPSGTLLRTTFDTNTVTLQELAERVAALISDLKTEQQLLKA